MKYITAFVLTIFSLSVFAASQCDDNKTIYYGMNIKHTKEVQVCDLGSKISYQFGPVGKNSEIMLIKNKSDVWKSEFSLGQNANIELYIPNGKHTYKLYYECSACGNPIPAESGGIDVYNTRRLDVEPIATIDIDKETIQQNISETDIPLRE